LLSSLKDPGSAKDRDLFVPYHLRGSYAVINSNYRYIYYLEGTEEFYKLKEDPNEWNNLAGNEEYRPIIDKMKKVVPEEFAPEATSNKKLKLVFEEDGFHWEHKEDGEPLGEIGYWKTEEE